LNIFLLEDPYFIDEDLLIERETLLTEEDKEVILVLIKFNRYLLLLLLIETS
jgi:hypothetical protein